jgi:hypothetical protein
MSQPGDGGGQPRQHVQPDLDPLQLDPVEGQLRLAAGRAEARMESGEVADVVGEG